MNDNMMKCTESVSKAVASSCGCGGSGCASCNEGPLMHPVFFPGQLLTDDDLQSMMNYVLTKHRLHNRFLHGSGVACGLEVTCHPCDRGKVIVRPGYALDCCGNDILVPCAVEVDIPAMVRELRLRQNGQDCGDPCDKTGESYRKNCGKNTDLRRYCLYIVYCEETSDPVAPYIHDESCADIGCLPTRVREGYRFELRCPVEDEDPPDLFDRIAACIGDLREAEFITSDLSRMDYLAKASRAGVRAYRSEARIQFDDADIQLVDSTLADLHRDAELFMIDNIDNSAGDSPIKVSDRVLRRTLDNVHALGSAIARYELLDSANREKVQGEFPEFVQKLDAGRELLMSLAPRVISVGKQNLTAPLELAFADASISNTLKYIDPKLAGEERKTLQANIYAQNSAMSASLSTQFGRNLAKLRDWLLSRLDKRPPLGACSLRCDIASIVIPVDSNDPAMYTAAEKLLRAFLRYLLDCICAALLPPCPECEDPAVKLACLELALCDVEDICNLERTFLLTAYNMRYWIPFLHEIGEQFERLCCELSKRLEVPIDRKPVPEQEPRSETPQFLVAEVHGSGQGFFMDSRTSFDRLEELPVFPNLMRFAGLNATTLAPPINLAGNLTSMIDRQSQLGLSFANASRVEAAREIGDAGIERLLETPQVREMVLQAASNKMVDVEKKIEVLSADGMRAAEDLQTRINARVREVEAAVDKSLTATKLPSTPAIKKLREDLAAHKDEIAAQKKINKQLLDRLEKLEKAGGK